MYWSYLTNNQNETLAFESHWDYDKMVRDYRKLAETNFFSQFEIYDQIFISNKNPVESPLSFKLFELQIPNN
jgi:hypothetical protein